MRAGKYKGVRTPRPTEIAHGRCALATLGTEVYDNIDLALEGQAALIMALHWSLIENAVQGDANDEQHSWLGILTMDEGFNVTDLDSNFTTYLDDEDTLSYMSHSYQNVITTSGQTTLPIGFSEWQYFGEGLLAPETVRMAGIIKDNAGNIAVDMDLMVYYKRIENPTPAMKDYFYRRR